MSRTTVKFNKALDDVKHYLEMHKKSVWLVATEDNYALSVIKPNPDDLPIGTVAILYDTNLDIEDRVYSTKQLQL
jgi:hypothetical protein